jgi:hypothetical protein
MHDIKSCLSFCRSHKSTHANKNCGGGEVLYAYVVRQVRYHHGLKIPTKWILSSSKASCMLSIGEWIHQPITSKIQPNECCPLRATCIGSPPKMDSSAYNTIYLVSPSKVAMYIHKFGRDLRGGGPSLALST